MIGKQPLNVVVGSFQPTVVCCLVFMNLTYIQSVVTGFLLVVVEFDVVETIAFFVIS